MIIRESGIEPEVIALDGTGFTSDYAKQSNNIQTRNIYKRNNVESVFSSIKRVFSGVNQSRSSKLAIKETKLTNVLYNIYRSAQIN